MKFTRSADGRYVLGENSPPFSTIPEVIHFYTTHKLPIRGAEHMSLLYPVIVQTLWHWHTHSGATEYDIYSIFTYYLPVFLHAFSSPFYLHCPQEIGLFGAIFSFYYNPSNYTGSSIKRLGASCIITCELVLSLKSPYFNTMDSSKQQSFIERLITKYFKKKKCPERVGSTLHCMKTGLFYCRAKSDCTTRSLKG